ncbi:hypothetical protein [Thomasclavelia cocleata]|jgi:hypothetical protein|uniref:hypothetical protein n=3 Tax=Thomasclavelia cocleata TaxID=69824 RepID=UPI00242BCAA2|nr:hypothetical protein [Thomasclavelia cocleata]
MWYTRDGDDMEVIKWIVMIIGIFGLLIIGCLMLLRSDEKQRFNTKRYQENIKLINQTNEMLDETLNELESYNGPLKKVCEQINKFNHKFLKIK